MLGLADFASFQLTAKLSLLIAKDSDIGLLSVITGLIATGDATSDKGKDNKQAGDC